jgi:hypothetical protein
MPPVFRARARYTVGVTSPPAVSVPHASPKAVVPWLVAVAFFMESLDTTILNDTSINTLGYADVSEGDTSMASTMASTTQQLSVSFGVAAASLTAAVFIPDRFHATGDQIIRGIHLALLALVLWTLASAALFRTLRPGDGDALSRHNAVIQEG